jgi:ppGpp synthetase/RelA/SpoT-type nucleotidyltranferase
MRRIKRLRLEKRQFRKKNYQVKIGDLLGVRMICFGLSDVEKVEA